MGPSFSLIPKRVTICLAVCVTLSRSLEAPVVISSKTTLSAALPPSIMASCAISCPRLIMKRSHVGVPALVIGCYLLLLVGDEPSLPLGTCDHAVYGLFHLGHVDLVLVVTGRQEGGLVDEVGKVGSGEARGPPGKSSDLHVGAQGLASCVHP